jgi:DNA repair exonuclease SbcCD nuclease subunit
MKILVFSDPHIEESSLDELNLIFSEIIKEKADQLIILGDYFDKKGRVSSKELIFGSKWLKKFKQRYERVVWVSGNHDNTQDVSLADIFKPWGIEVTYGSYLASDGYNSIYYGHEFAEDTLSFDTNAQLLSLSKLKKKKVRFVFLGHYHDHRIIADEDDFTACYVGSCRYIKFDEKETIQKYFIIIDHGEVKQYTIESAIPLKNIEYSQIARIETLNSNTKVRLILHSLNEYKNVASQIPTWTKKFTKFVVKHDYLNGIEVDTSVSVASLAELVKAFLDKIEDKSVRTLLEQEFKKESIL